MRFFDRFFSLLLETWAMNLSANGTHASREMILHFARRWMSRKRRSFGSWRGSHQDARYYIVESYCPREDRIRFRVIVPWHLGRRLSFGDKDVSITWSHPLLPDSLMWEIACANGNCARLEMRAFVVTDRIIVYKIAQFGRVTANLLLKSPLQNFIELQN